MSSTELCRLCAGRSDEIPIFGSKEYLPYKINFTLNIEVKETDNRKTICLLCKSKLTEFHDFKNMCRNTEAQGLGSQKSSEIPPILAVKIKEEPKDFQEVVKQLASVPVPNAEPIKLVPVSSLPFLFKNDVKKEEPDSDSVKSPRTSPASNSSVESSVDYLINQVDTDDSKSSLEDGKRDVDKGADSPEAGGLEIAAPADSTSCEDAATADHISSENCALENSSSLNTSSIEDDAPGGEEAPANGGGRGRGRKRRGRQPEPELKKRRLTRSSSGVLPKKKIIIDESEDDSDPDDPEYREQGQQPVSDSESDEETQSPSGKATKTATKSPTKSPAKSPSPEVKPNSSKTLPEGTCVKCEKQFPSLMALESHQMEDHFNETWYCYDCLCGFPNFKTWKYHKRNFCKRSAVIRICTLCQGSFKSYEELKVHAETCKGTSEKGANASLPVKIIDPPNGKPTFRCSFCAIETDDNTEFLEHLKVHKKNSVSSLKCNQCDKTFKEKGALICHKEFHHKNTKLSNSASDKTPTVKSSVISDKIDDNSKTVPSRKYSKEYKCNKCDEVFSNSGKLICHQVLSHKKK